MARRLDVLLVDDDEDIVGPMADLLRLKYEVRVATGLRQALELLVERVPDAVVCDLELSPYRGDVLLSMIAREHPQVRRVLHSSFVPAAELPHLAGVAHVVLVKPSSIEDLLAAIDGD